MTNVTEDAPSPRLISFVAHEIRNPTSVVMGYIRMVLKAGALNARDQNMLELSYKSCTRLTELANEISEWSKLESGTEHFKRAPLNVRAVLADALEGLPAEQSDRDIAIELAPGEGSAMVGDAPRLKKAFASVLFAIRREATSTDRLLINEQPDRYLNNPVSRITIAAPDAVEALSATPFDSLRPFDECRGGCGMTLVVARLLIVGHGGGIWSPANPSGESTVMNGADLSGESAVAKGAAVIALPLS